MAIVTQGLLFIFLCVCTGVSGILMADAYNGLRKEFKTFQQSLEQVDDVANKEKQNTPQNKKRDTMIIHHTPSRRRRRSSTVTKTKRTTPSKK